LPTELSFSSTLNKDSLLINSANLKIPDNELDASGRARLTPEFGFDLDIVASGSNLNDTVNLPLADTGKIALPKKPWQTKTSFGYRAGQLNITTKSANIGSDQVGFDGTVKLGGLIPAIDAIVAASGSSMAKSLEFTEIADIPDKPYTAITHLSLSENNITLTDVDGTLNDDRLTGSIVSEWPERPEDILFDVVVAGDNLRETVNKIGSYIPPDKSYQVTARGEYNAEKIRLEQLEADFNDAHLSVDGSIDLDPDTGEQKLRISLSGPRLSDLGELEAFAFRPVPFNLSANVTGVRNDLTIKDFALKVNDNDVKGTISIDLRGKPVIATKLTSSYLDLDQLLERAQQIQTSNSDAAPLDTDPVTPAAKSKSIINRTNRDKKLLSDTPIDFSILKAFDGEYAIIIKELILLDRTVRNLGVGGRLANGFLDTPIIRGDTAYGDLKADIEVDASQTPTRIKIKARATKAVLGTSEMLKSNLAKLPRSNIVTRFTTQGDSAQELGAGVTGYFWMTVSEGVLPTNSLSLLVGDLLTQIIETLNPFAKKQTSSPITCGAIYLEAKEGVIETSPGMILQTDRVSIVAAGDINLKNEKINIGFRTSALKGIGVSASDLVNPFIKLGGNLSSPNLVLDPTSTAIQGGAAFMTMGASLLANSMWNRWITSNGACERMGKEAAKIRRKINPDHMPVMPKIDTLVE
jgi:hypothetical protein